MPVQVHYSHLKGSFKFHFNPLLKYYGQNNPTNANRFDFQISGLCCQYAFEHSIKGKGYKILPDTINQIHEMYAIPNTFLENEWI